MLTDIQIGDLLRMRKQHPCGGWVWEVSRIGADIGIQCQTCQRRVMLTRRELNRRAKSITPGKPNEEPKALPQE